MIARLLCVLALVVFLDGCSRPVASSAISPTAIPAPEATCTTGTNPGKAAPRSEPHPLAEPVQRAERPFTKGQSGRKYLDYKKLVSNPEVP